MSNHHMMASVATERSLRIDKLLWFFRFCRNRSIAKKMAEKGHIRLNGRRVDRAHLQVRANDILTIPIGREVRIIRVISLPKRRGAASDAQGCYEILKSGY